jgi:methylated-DNA-[protein]-cysteine S-methyltransferase
MEEQSSIYYQSPVGLLRISGTENYISEIHFIDNIEQPLSDHHEKKHFPIVIQCVEELIQYFQGQRRIFEFPINQQGTDFQQKVWNELTGIPFGKTISYLELSRRLGDTKVIRAAASANGKNNIVIVVPCHRVIGSKNDLVGYGGGLGRKKWLLEHEAKITYGIQTLF